jgi:hypothetical protein
MSTDIFDLSAAFRRMADKMEMNASYGFAGAFVIAPPDGDVSDLLVLDSKANPAIFWSTVRTKADIAIAELEQEQRGGGYR